MGLKQKLNIYILDKDYATLDEVYAFAQSLGYKQKTAERELNPSRSPDIITERNAKGHIVGYRHSKKTEKVNACCSDMLVFGEHFKPCPITELAIETLNRGLF